MRLFKFKLPLAENRNVLLFYVFSIIQACFFAEGNWIFMYLLFFNYGMIGLLDSIAFGIGLLLEIPTGAAADLIGRKNAIRISFFIVSIGILMQGLAGSPLILFLGNVLYFTGLAFYSGSMDALTYDSLIIAGNEKEYQKVVATSKSLQAVAYVFAVIIGGYAASINIRFPFLLWGGFHAIAFFFTFFLKEPQIDSTKVNLKSFIQLNYQGIKQLLISTLRPFLFFIFVILGVVFWYDWGFIKPAVTVSFGFDAISMGYLFAIKGILVAILIQFLPAIRNRISDFMGLAILNILTILCVFLFGTKIGFWGFIPIILISIIGTFAYSWISIIINKEIESTKRATALSTVSTILKIPYVLTAFWSGKIIEEGYLSQFLFAAALFIGIFSLLNIVKNIKYLAK